MEFIDTPFSGLFIVKPNLIGDDRGWFMKTYSERIFEKNVVNFNSKWVETNHSYSKIKGTWRGLHYQNTPYQETKLIRCVSGGIIDYVVDIRKNSNTFLNFFRVELTAQNMLMLYIPRGFAHGFLTIENDTQLIYMHDEFYNPEFEAGIRFDDPLINLSLPFLPNNISERDKTHKLLNNQFKGI